MASQEPRRLDRELLRRGPGKRQLHELIDRYTDVIEWDLQLVGLDLVDFYRGRHSWRKLANVIDKLQRTPTSWLVWAMQNDVERMRELSHAGLLDQGGEWKPETFQYGTVEQILAALLVTVQSALRGEGDPRPTPIVPRTARTVLDAEANDAAEVAIYAVMVEVSDDDYRTWVRGGDLPSPA